MILEDMPIEYYGKTKKSCGYTQTQPREWTENEIKWIQEKNKSGYSAKEIANKIGRSETSVSIKLKRLSKQIKYQLLQILELCFQVVQLLRY